MCRSAAAAAEEEGPPQSDALAVGWYRKAADQGHPSAQFQLGCMYQQGRGTLPQSDALAVEWYRRAADQGYAPAQCSLGYFYERGRGGLRQNYATAAEWYRRAADPAKHGDGEGSADAQCSLGRLYAQGKGVPQNLLEALRRFRRAKAQGHVSACHSSSSFIVDDEFTLTHPIPKRHRKIQRSRDNPQSVISRIAVHFAYMHRTASWRPSVAVCSSAPESSLQGLLVLVLVLERQLRQAGRRSARFSSRAL